MSKNIAKDFWKSKTLNEMNTEEWEALCDGCGKCCLIRLEDPDTLEVATTKVSCKLFDPKTCQCTNYSERQNIVPTCVQLTPSNIKELKWLPKSCSYRLVSENKELPSWHHLVSGNKNSIHEIKASMKNKTISEQDVNDEDWVSYIIED